MDASTLRLIETANELREVFGKAVTSWPLQSEKRRAWRALDDALRDVTGIGDGFGTTGAAVRDFIATEGHR